jgi:thiamine-phosphate pyrophosphorylase
MIFPEKGIYFIFNPSLWKKKPWQNNIEKILPHVSAIQLRAPELNDRDFFLAAKEFKEILATYKMPLIINNRLDIALSMDADGVHLGPEDISINEAKKIFKGIIGATGYTPELAGLAQNNDADYIGCGPVFPTKTKKLKREVIGIEGYISVKNTVEIPVIPIGGINQENADQIKGFAEIVAVSSAINLSKNPVKVAREIKEIIQ